MKTRRQLFGQVAGGAAAVALAPAVPRVSYGTAMPLPPIVEPEWVPYRPHGKIPFKLREDALDDLAQWWDDRNDYWF